MAGSIRCSTCTLLVPTTEFLEHQDDHLREADERHEALLDWLEKELMAR